MKLSKIHSFIKNDLTLERVNKYALLVAFALLLIRSGDFNSTFMPKPFEAIFVLVTAMFTIDLIKNKKIKEFWMSIPRNIWLTVGGVVISVAMGWSITLLFRHFPMDKEMIAEFGRMIIALMTFLFVFFYTRNDKDLLRKYFYALLSPVFYILLLFIPKVADFYNLTLAGRFIGFTNNLNTTTKILVVPATFLVACALFEEKNRSLKIVYIAASSCMTALLFWTSSRGGLLAFFAAVIFIFIMVILKKFSWKRIAGASLVAVIIILSGFLITPHSGKQVVLERALNSDTEQVHYFGIKDKSLKEIVESSLSKRNKINDLANKNLVDKTITVKNSDTEQVHYFGIKDKSLKEIVESSLSKRNKINDLANKNLVDKTITVNTASPETRIDIWSYAIKQMPFNLLGAGPAFNLFYAKTPLSGGSHNSILQIFFEGGIVGFLCFGYILFAAFNNLKNGLAGNFDKFIFSLSGATVALLIALMFDANVKMFLFWVLLAIAINIKSENRNEKRE